MGNDKTGRNPLHMTVRRAYNVSGCVASFLEEVFDKGSGLR